jgi:hypothetical protein
MAELPRVSEVCRRDSGSNLGTDEFLSDSVCIRYVIQIGMALTLEHHLLIYIFILSNNV